MRTVTADEQKRVRIPDAKPRQKFSYENLGNGVIKLIEIEEKSVPLVKARKVNGRWIGADFKLDREAVVNSLREDREQ